MSVSVDLYVLLDVFGSLYAYPSWSPISGGLDYQTVEVASGAGQLPIIPEFIMPPTGPLGPLYFYAAMFYEGYLDLGHLASNGDSWTFSLQ